MTPAAVTSALLHDLVTSSRAEGTGQFAVAAAITDGGRVLLCGHTTGDFDQEWDLPSGIVLPGETLTSALDRVLACSYGLDIADIPGYLGSHDRIRDGDTTRTFAFTATCADPAQICQHARGDRLGRGDHRPASRRPALLQQRGRHPPPSRQPGHRCARQPAPRPHRTRQRKPPPDHQRRQARRRADLSVTHQTLQTTA
jgi:ADP-ribose pyrophosphatase YjhB (NUDIX family)